MADRRLLVEGLETRSLLSLTAINFGATVTSTPVAIGNELLFTANDPAHGTQLWETNGTAAGTAQLTNINDRATALNPTDLTAVGNTLYFVANDGADGDQLWRSDGTAAGTADGHHTATTAAVGVYPSDLTAVGGPLYFVGYDPQDRYQLFVSNGTAAGTDMVADINGGRGTQLSNLTAAGNDIYFQADDATYGYQLWVSDGTAAGTVRLTTGDTAAGGTYPTRIDAVRRRGVLRRLRRGQRLSALGDQRDGGGDGGGLDPRLAG